MEIVDLILNGITDLEQHPEWVEKYNNIGEDGKPINIPNDIEIINFIVLPCKEQIELQNKLRIESIYGVRVRVNAKKRVWRAAGATFATGLKGKKVVGNVVAEGTMLILSLFELFFNICDYRFGLNIKVADSDKTAYFTAKQGKFAEGNVYPDMILRFEDKELLDDIAMEIGTIDEEGVLHNNEEYKDILLTEGQTLLNELFPNNIFKQCRNVEEFVKGNKRRFEGILHYQAKQVLADKSFVEEVIDTEDNVKVLSEEEYYEYLYGNDEYLGIYEDDEEASDLPYYEVVDDDEIDDDETDTSEVIEEVFEDGVKDGNDVEPEINNELIEAIENSLVTGGIMSEEVGNELKDALIEAVKEMANVGEKAGSLFESLTAEQQQDYSGVGANVIDRAKQLGNIMVSEVEQGERVNKFMQRINKAFETGRMRRSDELEMMKCLVAYYEREYKEFSELRRGGFFDE